MPLRDNKIADIVLGKLSIPNSMIYTLTNTNSFGISLKIRFDEIKNTEIVGANGTLSNKHSFDLPPGGTDVFILRETQLLKTPETNNGTGKTHFGIRSIRGEILAKIGKEDQKERIYEYLLKH